MSIFTSPTTTLLFTNETTSISSLDELLYQLGFEIWEIVINAIILPPINLIGILLCSFSFWIFSRPSFEDPIFFYYKLLCIVNIIHLIHNIPACLFFSPFYFPMFNSYATSVFLIYYASLIGFLFHFEDVLQIAILLHKMKLFVPFVKKYFTVKPQLMSLVLFPTCLLINLPLAVSFKIAFLGDFSYTNSNGVEQTNTFYFPISSDFSQTLFGFILIGFTSIFLNQILTFHVGVTFNIFSYIKYKRYSIQRKREFEHLQMSSIHNRPTTSREIEQQRHRERTEQDIEKNMLKMSLTLCTISILSWCLIIVGSIFYFVFNSFQILLLYCLWAIQFSLLRLPCPHLFSIRLIKCLEMKREKNYLNLIKEGGGKVGWQHHKIT